MGFQLIVVIPLHADELDSIEQPYSYWKISPHTYDMVNRLTSMGGCISTILDMYVFYIKICPTLK